MNRLILAGLVLITAHSLCFGSSLEKIPVGSWIYGAVDRLYASGLFPKLHRSVRPYSRGDVVEGILNIRTEQSAGKISLADWQGWILERLEDEFESEIRSLESDGQLSQVVKLNPSANLRLNDSEDGPALGRGQFIAQAGWGWEDKVFTQTRGILDNRGENDPNFNAQPWKKGMTGMFDRGYISFRVRPLDFTFGRDYARWGPVGQGLLMSGNAPALDFLGFELGGGRFKFSYFTSRLDDIYVPDSLQFSRRYISGHRLNYRNKSGWEIGLSEIIVYGGVDRSLELFYLNPFLPFYVEQFNHNVDDNSLWNIEFALTFWKNKEFYGEVLIDDFQYDFVSEPNQLGFVLGTRLADFLGWENSFWNLEYTRVGTFVYGQQRLWNRYTYNDVVVGHLFGSDFDLWRLSLEYLFLKDFVAVLEGSYRRQGEMTADSLYQSPLPDLPFPSGVVEKVWMAGAGVSFQPDAHLMANINFAYQDFKNFGHLSGLKESNWNLSVRLDYNFWREFWFR